jgi:predicted ATP-grasp superfamily ATP-dependent carboligase
LARQRGGSGGSHIRSAGAEAPMDAGTYFQRRVEGRPVSALVLSDGVRCAILGLSEQWAVSHCERPFRFNGAVRPASIPGSIEQALTAAVRRFCSRTPLVGLNSLDFLASDEGYWLLEVNPRPGATLDIFEPESPRDETLFALHVAACNCRVGPAPRLAGAVAAQIVYSDSDIVASPDLAWPAWARDRQSAGSRVAKDAPFCTVVARGSTAVDARRTLAERAAAIETLVRSSACASAA